MKKFLSILLMFVIAASFLTGCSDPVYDDLENYLNVEMKQVNADYEKLTAEVGTWETMENDAAIMDSLNNVLLPIVNGSLEALKEINPATEEVKAIKEKYVKVMETYKESFEALAEGAETQDEETIMLGYEKMSEAVDILDEYNKALEELAEEYGSEIEY